MIVNENTMKTMCIYIFIYISISENEKDLVMCYIPLKCSSFKYASEFNSTYTLTLTYYKVHLACLYVHIFLKVKVFIH